MPPRRQSLEEFGRVVPSSLSGSTLVEELLRNMEAGRFEMAYTVLLPCVFIIYLNPDDHAALSGILDFVIEDARRALQSQVAGWNRGAVSAGKRNKSARKEYKIASRDWQFEFLSESEVARGDVEIHSQLNERTPPGFRGTRTTLLGGPPVVEPEPPKESLDRGRNGIYAALHYEDESGAQTCLIRQNQFRVGRGGDNQPVDLALKGSDEISRQHLLLRRDPATGVFLAIDSSTNGTTVNGKRLVKGSECRLPERAEICLGEAVTLLFEARD